MHMDNDYFTEDHDIYFFLAAHSNDQVPNEHIIHEIRFFDTNHLHDNEEVDNMDDLKPFTGRHLDQLRKGNIQSED